MKNWKIFPQDSYVIRFVECYWFLEKEKNDSGNNYPKLNPDPTAHLILADDVQKNLYTQDDVHQQGSGSHWIFPHSKTFVMDHSHPFAIIGIKFRVGALYSLNLTSSKSHLNTVIGARLVNELIQAKSFSMSNLLDQSVEDPEQVCNMLDDLLLPRLFKSSEDRHKMLVNRTAALIMGNPISQIGEILHCSQRTIERSFLRVTGLTLKQYRSMIRLESILNYLYNLEDKKIDWVDVANEFEFSDQPHLIRHLKHAIGTTPGEYAKQRNLAIDVYGNFE